MHRLQRHGRFLTANAVSSPPQSVREMELASPSFRRRDMSAADMHHAKQVLSGKRAFIIDCDGVIYHSSKLLPGAKEFVQWLHDTGKRYIFLTNSSDKTPQEMRDKFIHQLGFDFVTEDHFFTSALATAQFLKSQKGAGSRAYVIGQPALHEALKESGIHSVSQQSAEMSAPDFVVVGETGSSSLYHYDLISLAIKLVRRGSRLVGTNEDLADRVGAELHPGTGALILPISAVCGTEPYFVGKPNPIMVVNALERLCTTRQETIFIGDRMNTDVRAGMEAQVDTCLVLSGVTDEEAVSRFSFRPSIMLNGVGDVPAILGL
ncbi:TIGR01457 family HAD hydrolase [Batrachochytrium salamandrivorans]|nr:TIGR01457 family HAD hydrolase [Batrachochytrium salamandrivorans]